MAWQTLYLLLDLTQGGGLSLSTLRATIWEAYSQRGPGETVVQRLDELETVQPAAGALSFAAGPTTGSPTRDICLGIRITGEPGTLFRSGRLATLPTAGSSSATPQLDLVLPNSTEIPTTDFNLQVALNAGLGGGFGDGSQNLGTAKSLSLTSAFPLLTARVAGTTGIASSGTPFTYALELAIAPETDVRRPAGIVIVTPQGLGTLNFDGAAPDAGRQQAIRNALRPAVVARVTSALDSVLASIGRDAALTALDGSLGRPPAAAPASALISARRVVAGGNSIGILPCLGGFELMAALYPPVAGGGSKCPARELVRAGLVTADLALLRTWRDRDLRTSALGEILVARFETHAAEVSDLLAHNRSARDVAARALTHTDRWLRGGRTAPLRVLVAAIVLAARLRPHAGSALAHDLAPTRVALLGSWVLTRTVARRAEFRLA